MLFFRCDGDTNPKKSFILGSMDNTATYRIALTVLFPVYSALSCGLMVWLSYRDCYTMEELGLKRILLLYLSISGMGWLVTFCYQFYPVAFVYLNVVCLICYVLPSLFFYRIIRYLTRTGLEERFPRWHYLLPGALAAAMLVWSAFVPFGVQEEIVRGRAEVVPAGYEAYTWFFTLKPLLRVVFGIAYYVLTLALLVSYYRKTWGRDMPVRKPAGWVVFLIGISVASLLSSVLPTFMPRSRLLYSQWTAVVSCGMAIQHMLLSYHIIRREYRLYTVPPAPSKAGRGTADDPNRRRTYNGTLDRNRFERFLSEHKPYLTPGYKMTDLVEALDVNRTVVSSFINHTYGVNFNRYLNQCRLRELERLRSHPANRGRSVSSLIGLAGFGDFRSYTRAVAAEREAAVPRKETGPQKVADTGKAPEKEGGEG